MSDANAIDHLQDAIASNTPKRRGKPYLFWLFVLVVASVASAAVFAA